MRKWLGLVCFLMLICASALAQTEVQTEGRVAGICGSIYSIFSPPCSDKSLIYLSQIFGQVGGVVSGGQDTLFQQMFSIFNATVLGLGSMVIMYTIGVGVLKTAHEGEVLGRQWSSAWIPIRSALGIAFLVPAKASGGYSFIQVLVMWMVVQGVGAADALWNKIIDGLSEGSLITTPVTLTATSAFNSAFKSMVCMYAVDKIENDNTAPTYSPQWDGNKVTFYAGATFTNKCGTISVASNATDSTEIINAKKDALQVAMNDMQIAAVAIVYNSATPGDLSDVPTGTIVKANTDYNLIFTQAAAQAATQQGQPLNDQAVQNAKDIGWIFAGAYYYDIASINDQLTAQIVTAPSYVQYGSGFFGDANNFPPPDSTIDQANFSAYMTAAKNYKEKEAESSSGKLTGSLSNVSVEGSGGDIIGPMWGFLNDSITWFKKTFSGESSTGQINPMFAMQSFGMVLLLVVEAIWIGIAIVLFGIAVALTFGNVFSMVVLTGVVGFINAILWLLSLLTPVMMLMFTVGGMLAYYIPLMPYFYFTFGAIGWLATTIEAMVAAPLVALGILHPEEHEVFGAAKPAIMIIVNVFLTPTLMLFGLMGAMALSYIVIDMINFGFTYSMTAVDPTVASFSNITTYIAMLVAYGAFVTYALQKCFSLIGELRNKALRWIGAHGEGFGEEQSAGQIRGAMGEAQQTGGKMGQEATKGGLEKGGAEFKAKKEAKEQVNIPGGGNV